MKLQLLPSTFDDHGGASARQHLACFVIDDRAAIDAGSLAMAADRRQKEQIRDVILTHAHLDHIAGLPLFIDDLFADLDQPIKIHATGEIIEVLQKHIFNWAIYPDFTELENTRGKVLQYIPFEVGGEFAVGHLQIKSVAVNHKVPAVGYIISDGAATIAISGDTARAEQFWQAVNREKKLDALLVECAFPDELKDLAESSHHLTPQKLKTELKEFHQSGCPIYVINLKPMYRARIIEQIEKLAIENLQILEVGRVYEW